MLSGSTVLILAVLALALALRWAPRTTIATALVLAALLQNGVLDASALPLAGEASAVRGSVSEWQRERIDAGACFFGTAARLGGEGGATPEAKLPPSCPQAPPGAGASAP